MLVGRTMSGLFGPRNGWAISHRRALARVAFSFSTESSIACPQVSKCTKPRRPFGARGFRTRRPSHEGRRLSTSLLLGSTFDYGDLQLRDNAGVKLDRNLEGT